ncbi:hypothetical protein [Aureispira sp. CCB-QB1]|uniref:hypothetical protein n=1 Tax=Aureispira sp. CCB-QB1 TaxID=1313421 RepID=UPI000695FEBE|nr:hypothetical protein [Aureispira sp. CCB-QB1]
MKLFDRVVRLDIDLKSNNLCVCANYTERGDVWSEEFYLEKVVSPNHLRIANKGAKVYTKGVHNFIYNKEQKELLLESRHNKSAVSAAQLIIKILTQNAMSFQFVDYQLRSTHAIN